MTATAGAGRTLSTWDAGRRPETPRLVAAGLLLAFAAVLAARPGLGRSLAPLVLLDVLVICLPWRVPRAGRRMSSLWLETVAYQAMPLGCAVLVALSGPAWARTPPAPFWWALACAAGLLLVRLGGVRLRLLARGDLAFLAGPEHPAHAAALAWAAVVAAIGEEAMFRSIALTGAGAGWMSACLLGAVAFVARHHLPRAGCATSRRADLLVQGVSALVLLGLTLASGSLYPAMLCHLVHNTPAAVLAVQRARQGGFA